MNMENTQKSEIIKNSFILFLKSIRKRVEKRYYLITIYFFIIRTNLKKLLDNVEKNVNDKNLRKIALSYNYTSHTKRFFNMIKKKILMKSKNPERFKSRLKFLACREIYLKNFKRKILNNLKIFRCLKKKDEMNYIKLLNMKSKYLSRDLLKRMKNVSRINFLNINKGRFIQRFYFRKLKIYSKGQIQTLEIDRKIRRLNFEIKIKSFFYNFKIFKTNILPFIKTKKICNKKYFFFILNKQIRSIIKIKKCKINFFQKVKSKLFIRRVYKKIQSAKYFNSKISFLFKILERKIKRIFMLNLKSFELNQINKEKRFLSNFTRKVFFNKTFLCLQRNHIIIKQKQKYKLYFKQIILNEKLIFFSLLKFKRKNTIALNFSTNKIKSKVLENLRKYFNSMLEIKQKYILSLLNFRKNYIRKLFNELKMNKIKKKEKKRQYAKLKDQRDKIISAYLMKILISNVSKEINNREEMIRNIYVKRSSKGIQTALIWFKKLKNRIKMKKLRIQIEGDNHKTNNLSQISQIDAIKIKKQVITDTSHIEKDKVLDDINQLISLKNKKRFLPKKIDLL